GNVYFLYFQGQFKARPVAPVTVTDSTLLNADNTPGSVTVATRLHGINYYTVETMNIDLGSGNDVFNVQGTTARTNLSLHDGDERIYVSSTADFDQSSSTDFLTGHLHQITGMLNLSAGSGRHLLMISDEASTIGDNTLVISDSKTGLDPNLPDSDIYITGFAPAGITFKSAANGHFADGVTFWTSSGHDTIRVDGTHERNGVRTITTLNTGAGDDFVTANLTAAQDGFFVLNTEADEDVIDASASSLPLVLFGGEGILDKITGGTGNDIIFGDLGRVLYFEGTVNTTGKSLAELEALAGAVLGHGGPGNKTDGVTRPLGLALPVDLHLGGRDTIIGRNGDDLVFGGPADDLIFGDDATVDYDASGFVLDAAQSTNLSIGGNDTIDSGEGENTVAGGFGLDAITTGSGRDWIIGDNGVIDQNAAGVPIWLSTLDTNSSTGARDVIAAGEGTNFVLGGNANDEITTGSQNDVVLGDNGEIFFNNAGSIVLLAKSSEPAIGGDDTISTFDGDDLVIGGVGADVLSVGQGHNVVVGDNGYANYNLDSNSADLDEVCTTDPSHGGADTISTGEGDDLILGGSAADILHAAGGQNIVIGDNGCIIAAVADTPRFGNVPMTIGRVESTATSIGGNDQITSTDGRDLVIGGMGSDLFDLGDGHNVAVGDNGLILFDGATTLYDGITATLDLVKTTAPADGGGVDQITTGSGDDIVLGGDNADTIAAGESANVIVSDNGQVIYFGGELDLIESTEPDQGGIDSITSGSGNNTIVAGNYGDTITVLGGNNLVLGDSGRIDYETNTGVLLTIESTAPAL
ncbi:MAG: calcium-binding protein, partial [Verrucomicrobiota bacterium]